MVVRPPLLYVIRFTSPETTSFRFAGSDSLFLAIEFYEFVQRFGGLLGGLFSEAYTLDGVFASKFDHFVIVEYGGVIGEQGVD